MLGSGTAIRQSHSSTLAIPCRDSEGGQPEDQAAAAAPSAPVLQLHAEVQPAEAHPAQKQLSEGQPVDAQLQPSLQSQSQPSSADQLQPQRSSARGAIASQQLPASDGAACGAAHATALGKRALDSEFMPPRAPTTRAMESRAPEAAAGPAIARSGRAIKPPATYKASRSTAPTLNISVHVLRSGHCRSHSQRQT